MEEKVLVKSERYNIGRALLIIFLVISIPCLIWFLGKFMDEFTIRWPVRWTGWVDTEDCEGCETTLALCGKCYTHAKYSSFLDMILAMAQRERWIATGVIGGSGFICLLIYVWMRSYEMIVTDKRVYGQAAFGTRVDLPIDSVSAVASGWPKGIAVATSSGKIAFLMIKNCDDIRKSVSNLLIERQSKSAAVPAAIKQESPQSNVEEIKKYKELLDSGIITQEEFDAKKKQLLEL